ncbi:MAG: DUF5615 family PIN-like protein [Opitutaceae bacterium]|nr:DUF5615 family PIN-like protein [Opitutaceae bacterium]
MSSLRFQLDEDCQATALAAALWQHAIEVVTTNAAGLRGVDDETQLREAALHGRTIVTNNIRDFVPLHTRWLAEDRPPHAGIVVFAQQEFSVGEIVRRLARMSQTVSSEEMKNRLEWLSAWGGS